MDFEFTKDNYASARGTYSRILNLYCRKCAAFLANYQKDGPGNLRRLYMDRLLYPEEFSGLQHKSLHKIENLICPHCNEILGTPYIYPKEKRKAFRLYQDAIVKEIRPKKETKRQ